MKLQSLQHHPGAELYPPALDQNYSTPPRTPVYCGSESVCDSGFSQLPAQACNPPLSCSETLAAGDFFQPSLGARLQLEPL